MKQRSRKQIIEETKNVLKQYNRLIQTKLMRKANLCHNVMMELQKESWLQVTRVEHNIYYSLKD